MYCVNYVRKDEYPCLLTARNHEFVSHPWEATRMILQDSYMRWSVVSGNTRSRQLVAPEDGILGPRSGGATMMYGTRIPVTHLTLAWAGLTYIRGHSETILFTRQHTRNHTLHTRLLLPNTTPSANRELSPWPAFQSLT